MKFKKLLNINNILNISSFLLIIVAYFVTAKYNIFAQDSFSTVAIGAGESSNVSNVGSLIGSLINITFFLAAFTAFVRTLVCGVTYVTSSGNPDKVEGAKQCIQTMAIGLLLLMGFRIIIQLVLSSLGFGNVYNPLSAFSVSECPGSNTGFNIEGFQDVYSGGLQATNTLIYGASCRLIRTLSFVIYGLIFLSVIRTAILYLNATGRLFDLEQASPDQKLAKAKTSLVYTLISVVLLMGLMIMIGLVLDLFGLDTDIKLQDQLITP